MKDNNEKINELINQREVILHRARHAVRRHFLGEAIESMDLDIIVSRFIDGVVLVLKSYILAEEIINNKAILSVCYPSSWWQMLKNDYAPEWFKRMFPVRLTKTEKEYTFKVDAYYPQLPIVISNTGLDMGKILYRGEVTEECHDNTGGYYDKKTNG